MARSTYRPPPNIQLFSSEEERLTLDVGLKALYRVNAGQFFEDWMQIGEALKVITKAAVKTANSGPWHRDNKAVVRMFNGLWDHYEKSEGSNHKPLSSTERTALRFIMDHPEIEAWRDTLDGTKRRQLNHPDAVVTAWRKATQTPDKEAAEKAAAKEEVLVFLERKLAEAEKQLKHAKREAEWVAPENLAKAEEAIVAHLAHVSFTKKIEAVKRVASRLGINDVAKLLRPEPKRRRTYSKSK